MNITYLLGAGASYNALPVINELPSRLHIFESVVRGTIYKLGKSTDLETKGQLGELIEGVQWLQKEVLAHKTVDTLAKKFYVVPENEDSLTKLKKVMIAYFLFEQIRNTHQDSFTLRDLKTDEGTVKQYKEFPDKRYDSFIATVISKIRGNLSLSPNFKVLTWNYDVQFELAYERYLPSPTLSEIQKRLQIFPTPEFLNGTQKHDLMQFSITRLNGVAGISSFEKIKEFKTNEFYQVDFIKFISFLAKMYCTEQNEDVNAFSFAWEENSQLKTVHKNKAFLSSVAKEIMAHTRILVVIGYSFPNFNRSIDKELFGQLKDLKKVYVQDVNANEVCELMKSTFPFLNKKFGSNWGARAGQPIIEVVPISGVDQFFIPPDAEI